MAPSYISPIFNFILTWVYVLLYIQGKPVFVIGMNRCEGSIIKLKTPLAILEKEIDSYPKHYNGEGHGEDLNIQTEHLHDSNANDINYNISGIITSKIVFKTRP